MTLVTRHSSLVIAAAATAVAAAAAAGPFDNALLHGDIDKPGLVDIAPGEKVTFSLTLQRVSGEIPQGVYSLKWRLRGDGLAPTNGVESITSTNVFSIAASLDTPGFLHLSATVVDAEGKDVLRKFTGDATTPEGKEAMNRFERSDKRLFFSGGAGVAVGELANLPEPEDFDAFWERQAKRLEAVPVYARTVEVPYPETAKVRIYAVEIDCAGIRPATGYLTVPKKAAGGETNLPVRLGLHGYGYSRHRVPLPRWASEDYIALDINAHGMRLPEFGADDAYYKAFGWEIKSNGKGYAFDKEQNADPEVAYFNGMVLRVKRALQYLKTLPGWDGVNVWVSGGSQGGLQSIWAAGCGEGVTKVTCSVPWCCDLGGETIGRSRDGWFVPWTPALGYYDPVNFAKRVPRTCIVDITRAGLGDYTCPPSGVAALYNALPCRKSIIWVQGSTHGYVPPEPHQTVTIKSDE